MHYGCLRVIERYYDLLLLVGENLRKHLTVLLKEEVFFPKRYPSQATVGIVGEW